MGSLVSGTSLTVGWCCRWVEFPESVGAEKMVSPGVERSVGAGAVVAAGTSDEAKAPELEVSTGAVPECTVPSVQALMVVVM